MRKVKRVISSHLAPVGTFSVRRALPDHETRSVGPWVFLDHFGPFRVKPGIDGVGPHPHAGIETVTYLLSGRNRHRDSAGHIGVVGAGGAQWMTAGRGIIHAETPLAESEAEMSMHGIQLWTSLPRDQKMREPRYQRIEAADIPTIEIADGSVKVVAGNYAGTNGPAEVFMPLFLWHVKLEAGASFSANIDVNSEVAAYVISGEATFANAEKTETGSLAVFDEAASPDDAVEFRNGGNEALEILLLGGAPAEGPLVFHGPFVMNSIEQVRYAEKAYMTGAMGVLAAD
jgi:hypothetical protein